MEGSRSVPWLAGPGGGAAQRNGAVGGTRRKSRHPVPPSAHPLLPHSPPGSLTLTAKHREQTSPPLFQSTQSHRIFVFLTLIWFAKMSSYMLPEPVWTACTRSVSWQDMGVHHGSATCSAWTSRGSFAPLQWLSVALTKNYIEVDYEYRVFQLACIYFMKKWTVI